MPEVKVKLEWVSQEPITRGHCAEDTYPQVHASHITHVAIDGMVVCGRDYALMEYREPVLLVTGDGLEGVGVNAGGLFLCLKCEQIAFVKRWQETK